MAVDLGTVRAVVTAETGGFDKAMKGVRSVVNRVGRAAVAGGAAVAGLGAAMTAVSVRNAANFEQSITDAAAKTDDAAASMAAFEDAAVQAGLESAFSAKEAADALGLLAQSGLSTEDAARSVSDVLSLASAGSLELAEATDISTGVMQGFGLSVEELARVNDVLAATSTNASTDVSQLGQAMSFAAPTASGLGVEMEEVSAVMGLLADSNIKASRAGTSFNAIIAQMSKVADSLGADLDNADISSLGFAGSLDVLTDAGLNSDNALDLFGRQAGPALQALLSQGSESIREMTGDLKGAGGTAERIAKQQLDTLSGALTILQGTAETLSIEFGQVFVPAIQESVAWTQGLAESMTTADGGVSDFDKTLADVSDTIANVAEDTGRLGGVLIVLGGIAADVGKTVDAAFVGIGETLGAGAAQAVLLAQGESMARVEHVSEQWQGNMSDVGSDWIGGFGDATRSAMELSDQARSAGDALAGTFRNGADELRRGNEESQGFLSSLGSMVGSAEAFSSAQGEAAENTDAVSEAVERLQAQMEAARGSSPDVEPDVAPDDDVMEFTVEDVQRAEREEVLNIVGEPTREIDEMFPSEQREAELALMEAQLEVLEAETEMRQQIAMLEEAKAEHALRVAEIEAEGLSGIERSLALAQADYDFRENKEAVESRILELKNQQLEVSQSQTAEEMRQAEATRERVAEVADQIHSGVQEASGLVNELMEATNASDELSGSLNNVATGLEHAAGLGASLATGNVMGAVGSVIGIIGMIVDAVGDEEEEFDRRQTRRREERRKQPNIAEEVYSALDEAGLTGQQLGVENNYYMYEPVESDRRDVQSQRLRERADRASLLTTEEA